MMQAQDLDDPGRLAEIRWGAAIGAWQRGDPARLQAAILDPALPLTDDAREFLADLAAGTAQRRMGRPAERTPAAERELVLAVMREWDLAEATKAPGGSPQARAIAMVAGRHPEVSEEALRGVVNRLHKQCLTRELWARFVKPAEDRDKRKP